MWFSTFVKSKYIAPRTLPAAETHRNRRSKLKPCICSGLGQRNYEFVDDSWENSAYTSVLNISGGFSRQESNM